MSIGRPATEPGWYPDPDDPIAVRHWAGRSWSGRRRPLPVWSVASAALVLDSSWGSQDGADGPVLDGPVRAEVLPAIASASTTNVEPLRRRHPGTSSGRTSRPGRRGESVGLTQLERVPPTRFTRTRCSFLVGCCVAMFALLVAAVQAGNGNRALYSTVSYDRTYVTAANRACTTALGRRRNTPAVTSPSTTGSDAARIEASTAVLASLARTLGRMPTTPTAAPQIAGWLHDWASYVAHQRAYAAALVSPTAARTPRAARSLGAAAVASSDADRFAMGNGLVACTIDGRPSSEIESIP